VFYALSKMNVIVTGDIGCYSLGTFKPLNRLDTILCMGAGITMAHGMDKAGEPTPVVGMLGDSTFFHSGVTGLLDISYNLGTSTIIVVDNRTTAMTGHQDHPGTGRTLMGQAVPEVSIAEVGKACGFKRVRTIDPIDLKGTYEAIKEEIATKEPSLIISLSPCALRDKKGIKPPKWVDLEKCKECGLCVKLGCPALERAEGGVPQINEHLCASCGMCVQVCRVGAISTQEDAE
jgi:indolepyruvate ferredoxin oxidoreductase alpha subunit